MKQDNSAQLHAYDAQLREQYGVLCGVDEAGRGPLCGPVCVAAVILDPERPIAGLNDSKKLSEKKREELFPVIMAEALAYHIVMVPPETIDAMNILQASLYGMQQAIAGLSVRPSLALIDGNKCPHTDVPALAVVKGDAISASIAAASVLAKVSRDRYMVKLAEEYPQYNLAQHKGYPTKEHYALLDEHGIAPIYRRSFLKKRGYVHD